MRRAIQKGQPTPGDVHVNAALTNISIAYVQKASVFVADKVFPAVPVAQQSNFYYIYNKEDFLRDEAKVRAPASESAGGGFTIQQATYAAVVEAFHKDVDDQLRANADSVLSLDRAATEFVAQKMLIRRERKWVNSFFTTGVWGTDLTPGTLWSAATGSNPRGDVDTAKLSIASTTGFEPNTLVLGPRVKMALRGNDQIREQFKYTSADSIDDAMLARFFGVERVLTLGGVYTSGIEGGTQTTDFIAGKHALLTYTTDSPSLMAPTAGYTFSWSGLTGSVDGARIKKFRMEPIASDRIEAEHAYDMKVVVSSMGYFFNGAVA